MATRDDYRKGMDLDLDKYIHQGITNVPYTHSPSAQDLQSSILQKENELRILKRKYEQKLMSEVLSGPTRYEMQQHESLRNAWNEYLAIRALLGLELG